MGHSRFHMAIDSRAVLASSSDKNLINLTALALADKRSTVVISLC
jgi:hypothetical protein